MKPLLVTSRYGHFNDYIKYRFRSLLKTDFYSNDEVDECACPSCEGYCNTLNKDKCTNDNKCLWYTSSKPNYCKTTRTSNFCDCDKKYEKIVRTGKMMINQKFLKYFAEVHNITKEPHSRGLLVYHGLGSGKTCSGIILSNVTRSYSIGDEVFKRKIIIMIPANLNLDPWIKELSGDCNLDKDLRTDLETAQKKYKNKSDKDKIRLFKDICKEHDVYIIHYNAEGVTGGWRDNLKKIPNRKRDYFKNKYNSNYEDSDRKRTNPFDDAILIVDEAHNLSNNFAKEYDENMKKPNSKVNLIYNQSIQSKNSRVFLLTGTPIINSPFELVYLFNMVRGDVSYKNKKMKFEENKERFEKKFFKVTKYGASLKNEKLFRSRITGLVSYYSGINQNVFADKVYKDFRILMEKRFKDVYNNAWKQEIAITLSLKENTTDSVMTSHILSQQASNFCYPSWIFSINEQKSMNLRKNKKLIELTKILSFSMKIKGKKYLFEGIPSSEQRKDAIRLLDNDDKPLHIDNKLRECSTKMFVIMKKILQSDGPVLVYSRFKGGYGVGIFSLVLEQNGFFNYDCKKSSCKNSKKITKSENVNGAYMTWTPETRKEELRNIFNQEDNKYGDKIKVFVMTGAGKEGINLFGIRQVHILEPWYHTVTDRQVIGRAVRICSHAHIPKETFKDFTGKTPVLANRWLVNVFRYFSITKGKDGKPDLKKSVDYKISLTAKQKYDKETSIIGALQEQSIDCWLYNPNKEKSVQINGICDNTAKYYDNFIFWDLDEENKDELIKKQMMKISYKDRNLWVVLDTNDVLTKDSDNNYIRVGTYNKKEKTVMIDNYNEYVIPNKYMTSEFHGTLKQQKLIKTDREGLYSITKKGDSKIFEKYIKVLLNLSTTKQRKNVSQIAVDLTLGIGGDSIILSKYFKQVYAFEINPIRCQMGKENIKKVLDIQNVDIRCTNSIEIVKKFKNWLKYIGVNKVRLIHGDFPWGGPKYGEKEKIDDLYLESISWDYKTNDLKEEKVEKMGIYDMIKKIYPYADFISLKLPYNFNIKVLKGKIKGKVYVYNISKKVTMVVIET